MTIRARLELEDSFASAKPCAICGAPALSVVHLKAFPDYVSCAACGAAFVMEDGGERAMYGSIPPEFPETRDFALKQWTTLEAIAALAEGERRGSQSMNSRSAAEAGTAAEVEPAPELEAAQTPPVWPPPRIESTPEPSPETAPEPQAAEEPFDWPKPAPEAEPQAAEEPFDWPEPAPEAEPRAAEEPFDWPEPATEPEPEVEAPQLPPAWPPPRIESETALAPEAEQQPSAWPAPEAEQQPSAWPPPRIESGPAPEPRAADAPFAWPEPSPEPLPVEEPAAQARPPITIQPPAAEPPHGEPPVAEAQPAGAEQPHAAKPPPVEESWEPIPGRRFRVRFLGAEPRIPTVACAHCLRGSPTRTLVSIGAILAPGGQARRQAFNLPLCSSCYRRARARSEEERGARLMAHLISILVAALVMVGMLATGLVPLESPLLALGLLGVLGIGGYGIPAWLLLGRAARFPRPEDAIFVRSTLLVSAHPQAGETLFDWRSPGFASQFQQVNAEHSGETIFEVADPVAARDSASDEPSA